MTARAAALLALAAALAPAACASPSPGSSAAATATDTESAEVHRLRIFGMWCPVRCPLEVNDQLRGAPGVLRVSVDYDTKEATVRVAPGTDMTAVVGALRPPYSARLR